MLKTRARPTIARLGAAFAAFAALNASLPARAAVAGFSGYPTSASMGQPLDFAVGVHLEGGESLTAECVTAEVTFGERRLMPTQMRIAVEATGMDTARIRVQSLASIDEPLVAVQVNAGCGNKLSRRFVLMADPPLAPPPALLPMVALANVPEAAAMAPTRSVSPGTETTLGATATQPVPAAATRNVSTRAAPRPPRGRAAFTPAAGGAVQALGDALARASTPRTRTKATVQPRRVAAATARLKLEPAEPAVTRRVAEADSNQIIEDAIEAVAQAASAARATAAAASASAERMAALERSVEKLNRDAVASQALLLQSRERLQHAEDAARWTWPLVGAVLALGGLAVWLSLRLRTAQLSRSAEWRSAAAPLVPPEPNTGKQPTAPTPFVTAPIHAPATNPATRPFESTPAVQRWAVSPLDIPDTVAATVPLAPEPPPEPSVMRTDLLPPRLSTEEGHARDVSIEELIDLEQQAEFFVVLGQDEAAIDLLNEHLRQTGGGSPLPYLKLLEIHRRRGDRADYESMRERFNHRFNAYAPDWDTDMQTGRSLDDYPGVIPRLEEVWARPMDAMAELEALLFRKSRGELFDLPAYREVLFLYALARDLLDRESAGTGDVDLLLPLSLGSGFGSTAPAPFLGLGESEPQPAPGGAVDFDLSIEADRQTSIFDALEELPPTRRH